jgi:hypothetical protein
VKPFGFGKSSTALGFDLSLLLGSKGFKTGFARAFRTGSGEGEGEGVGDLLTDCNLKGATEELGLGDLLTDCNLKGATEELGLGLETEELGLGLAASCASLSNCSCSALLRAPLSMRLCLASSDLLSPLDTGWLNQYCLAESFPLPFPLGLPLVKVLVSFLGEIVEC